MNRSIPHAALAVAALLVSSASGQVVIVDDSFADGSPQNSGAEGETRFFNTSANLALDDAPQGDAAGSLEFVTGSSGRAIHTVFPSQTLANNGDALTARVRFTTPATVGSDENNGLRVGLFNQAGRNLAANFTASTSHPNPLLGDTGLAAGTASDRGKITGKNAGPAGFSADFDVNDLSSGKPKDELVLRRADVSAATGRLLATTKGFDSLIAQAAPNNVNGFAPQTDYEVTLTVTRLNTNEVQVEATLVSDGNVLNQASVAAVAQAFDFSVLGLGASSGAFGSSNSRDDADNGIRITHVTIAFEPAVVPDVEPDFEPS